MALSFDFLATLSVLAVLAPTPASAKVILGEPEVDRASDQYDGLWCPAEQIQMYNGTFTADGPEVTLEFIATNHAFGNWRHERIDNVIVVPLADRNATYHLPDSALAAAYFCLEPQKNYFHFSDVPPGNVLFLDQFHAGPNPGWDLTNGAYNNPGSSALNAFELPIDITGGSLGLGLDQVPTAEATTEITIDGFTAGQQYFVSTWTQCADPTIGDDLLIRIYGTEFFSISGSQPVDGFPSRGCAFADYDNDGDLDLYVTNFDSPSKLWRNNGGGVFQDVTNAAGLALTTLATAVAWGDGDNDGDLDLYVGTYAQNRYFKNNGNGTFTNATVGPLGDTRQTESVDWGDYDKDGDLDLFLANIGNDALLRNTGGVFTDVAAGTLLGSGRAVGCSWVDYDKDGDLDLFVTYNAQANELFVNTNGAFIKLTPALLATPMNSAKADWGDYDNDGDLDVIITTTGSGNRLYRNLGNANFVDATPPALADVGQGVESIWGDWDNDRDLDLYLIKNNQPNRLFRNEGAGIFVDHPTGTVESAVFTMGTAWGDIDGDGDLDLVVANNGASDVIYRNEFGDSRNWLHIDLKGTISNRFGGGAKVFVTAGGVTQLREVGGGSGLRSQSSLTAEFGLGSAITATVRVHWPSGIEQTITQVPGNQKILIIEGATDVAVVTAAPVLELNGFPNPFQESMTISYSLPKAGDVDLRIYDVAGRSVATLANGSKSSGRHTVEWHGVDAHGQSVAPGIYFGVLKTAEGIVTGKVVRSSG
jgi:hypothetical protein